MKQRAFAVASLLILTLTVGGVARSRIRNHLVIVNQSGQTIRFVTVEVGGVSNRFEDLPAGTSASAPFVIRGDDSFRVRGQLENGTLVAARAGYVTNGMYGENARFIIGPGGTLEFKQERARPRPAAGT